MTILSNCHTHTEFCDGRSSAEEMILSALAHGFRSIGFTSHAAQHFDLPYAIRPDREEAYRRHLEYLARKYDGRIRIRIGIERDLFSSADVGAYDYFIASVHYLPFRGHFHAVDGDAADLKALLDIAYHGDGIALTRTYYDLLTAYALAYHPPIIGHFDLIKKNNAVLRLFAPSSDAYERIVCESLDAIAECGCLLEVNTGGMARGYMDEPYPSPAILEYWRSLGGGVIASSDCHDASLINYGFDRLPEYIRNAGFDSISVLGCGKSLFETYPLSAAEIPASGTK